MTVRAWLGRDCVARVRVHYLLPRPLEVGEQVLFPDAEVSVTAFSAWSAGAKDHVRFTVGTVLDASGVLGEHELVVTYGKLLGERPAPLIAAIEQRLAARFGRIVHVPSRALALEPSDDVEAAMLGAAS